MAVGTLVWSGTATVPAAAPGVKGYVDVALAALGATDIVVVSLCHTAEQSTEKIKFKDFTFQVIKTAGTGFRIKSNQEQNPQLLVSYIVMTVSS